jgi:hypothetical protein
MFLIIVFKLPGSFYVALSRASVVTSSTVAPGRFLHAKRYKLKSRFVEFNEGLEIPVRKPTSERLEGFSPALMGARFVVHFVVYLINSIR